MNMVVYKYHRLTNEPREIEDQDSMCESLAIQITKDNQISRIWHNIFIISARMSVP